MLPFIIVLGDNDDFLNLLGNNNCKNILEAKKQQGWTLYRSKSSLYWYITDKVKNLTKQFMIYNNPIIYLIVNFKSSNYLDSLISNYNMVTRDLHNLSNVLIIGFNYSPKIHMPMKQKVLEWIVQNNLLKIITYTDAENFDLN
jgi:hypothetical protein